MTRAAEQATFPFAALLTWALFHCPVLLSLCPTIAPLVDVFDVQFAQLASMTAVPFGFDPVRTRHRFEA